MARINVRCKSNNLVREVLNSFSPKGPGVGGLNFKFMPGGASGNPIIKKIESKDAAAMVNSQGS